MPGLGSLTTAADIHFIRPVPIGQRVTATVTVKEKRPESATVVLDCACTDDSGQELIVGTLEVLAARQKIRHSLRDLPTIQLRHEDRYLELIKACDGLSALTTAVVHPCSDDALKGAIEAAERNLITPILIGPEKKIRAVAVNEKIDLSPYHIVSTEHSHHAAEVAVAMVRAGEAETLMKGSLPTIEAAALCKMADRGQIKGGLIDGPLAFDNAIDEEAAKTKGIVSPVAGKADILVVPRIPRPATCW